MSPDSDRTDTSSTLGDLISQRIVERFNQRISFAEFMDWALYHPELGYYATRALKIGSQGDFFTSPHLGVDFGELLAEQLVQIWELLEFPNPFTLVEMGAGQGLLAADILHHLQHCYPACLECVEYIIVERAKPLIAEQQRRLKTLAIEAVCLRWCSLEEIPSSSVTGCFFSNELVDALPVHQVVVEGKQLQEVYVTVTADGHGGVPFCEAIAELSTPRLAEYFDLVGIDLLGSGYPDRYRSEVNLAALDWISTVADRLQRGYVLTIDYGYPANRYYSPARAQGTLQCYYQHAHHSDPYTHVGQQDITAHVDFTALERQGDRCGLHTVGLTQQGLFLMALGLGDRIAALSQSDSTEAQEIQARLQRREAMHQLINPMGLGNFGVLVQSKGLQDPLSPLKGLRLPPL
jgi:SAM-dependent MidA family methyltransferase